MPKSNGAGGFHGTLEEAVSAAQFADWERFGYVCKPRSLKEGTEMSRHVTTAAVPTLSSRMPARHLSENLNMRCTCCLLKLTL